MEKIDFVSHVLRFRKEAGAYYTLSPYAKLIQLNETSHQLLLWCDEVHTAQALAERVQMEYGLDRPAAEAETEKFLSLMFRCGLLEKVK